MEYIIPVDFNAFRPTEFHSQWVGTQDQGVHGCFLVVTRVPPGTGTPSVHTHLGDQFYFLFKGEMNLQLADQVLKANAGDLVFIPCAVPHRNFNSTDEEEIHFEFIVPGEFPGLARSYRAEWPQYELKEAVNPYYIRPLDVSKFNGGEMSSVTLADYSTGSHHCQIDITRMPQGTGSSDLEAFACDQVYYTMTGDIEVQIGKDQRRVAPNSYVYLPAGIPHALTNKGDEVATHIHVQVPKTPFVVPGVPVSLGA